MQSTMINQLITETFDFIDMTYTGDNLTLIEYYSGGSGGEVVATLTLAYTGSQLDSITRAT